MKKNILRILVGALLFLPFSVMSQTTIEIDIAPNVLNIGSSGTVFTVHTDIAYGKVLGASCYINGIPIDWWKSDNQGNFVAKFNIDEVKGLPDLNIGGLNTFTLMGETKDGVEFSGKQEIKIINVVPAMKK